MKLDALMSRKVAGIPVVWIALAIGVVAVYGAIKLKPAPEVVDAPEDEEEEEFDGNIDNAQQPVFVANPVPQPSTADTDQKWSLRAQDWLRLNGVTPELATAAITKYLNEEPLNETERAAVNRAIQEFGYPPESTPNAPSAPNPNPETGYKGPATKQGTPPLTHVVKGTSDDSVTELSRLYYGSDSPDHINRIKSATQNLTNPGPYRVGSRVTIPKYADPKYYKATAATRDVYTIARKNGTTAAKVYELNNMMKFPVKVGTRVRVA